MLEVEKIINHNCFKVHAVNVHKIRSFSKYEDALVNLVSSWANWSREGDAELWVRIKDESMESENKRIHSVFTALHSKVNLKFCFRSKKCELRTIERAILFVALNTARLTNQ